MKHLSKTIFAFLYACSFVMAGSTVCYASQHPLPYVTATDNVPLAVNSTVVTNVEKHTAKYHIFSEKINMTAHVGELWQANGDVLYQTNNHDVTDLAKGEDGRYAVKFTNPGEAIIRVYYRKNGGAYVQDFLFTILRNRNRTLGENIAAGNPTPEEVVDSWMHSPGHRANILNKDFKELGVGYCYKDNSTYKHYWIQMFRG